MDYSQTIDYLFSSLPMFHRIGAAAYKADLNNTIKIANLLENPHLKFKTVHIAGTNGKGSTSHMLASILQTAGYKTGLYTSPHLKDFRERIRINGAMIPEKNVIAFVEAYKIAFEEIQPSFFEWTVGLAFQYFADEKVDISIIETGLGGRLDSTNIINPELSIITNISYDHKNLLGDTLEKIAAEKAGIIKTDIPVIIGERQLETENVFIQKAKQENSEISFASEKYNAVLKERDNLFSCLKITSANKIVYENLLLSLQGNYQLKNICTVLAAIDELRNKKFKINDAHILEGLMLVQEKTGLEGRWQTLQLKPTIICDVGHNEAGIKFILEQLKEYDYTTLRIVIGVVNDKDINSMLDQLPKNAVYYFCQANIPRALDAEELRLQAVDFNLQGKSYISVKEALEYARRESNENDLIFVGGSTFVVAEI